MAHGTGARTRPRIVSRRRYERIPCYECGIEIYRPALFGLREKRVPGLGTGINLSEVGMQFSHPQRLGIGENVRVLARLAVFQDVVEGEGTIVWCAQNLGAGDYLIGVEWNHLEAGHFDKIQQIRKTMRTPEFQLKLRTIERVKRESNTGMNLEGVEYKPPPCY